MQDTTISRAAQSAMAMAVWGLRGAVVHGHGRGGSQLGFPTANVALTPAITAALAPMKNGVFAGWACVEPETGVGYPMVMSVGFNPHFKDKDLTAEVHFVHKFPEDFYGKCIRVAVLERIREMQKYDSLQALIDDITNDCRRGVAIAEAHPVAASEYFAKLAPPPSESPSDVSIFVQPLTPQSPGKL